MVEIVIHSIEEFEELVETDYALSRWVTASSAIWNEILEQKPELKMDVALNKKLPDDILEILAHDTDDDIRFTIAMKRKLDKNIFEILSKDQNESVRMRIVLNPKVPKSILEDMLQDSWDEIVILARSKLNQRDQ
jgi:predicted regulator of amino acid metabolism with ACT domain